MWGPPNLSPPASVNVIVVPSGSRPDPTEPSEATDADGADASEDIAVHANALAALALSRPDARQSAVDALERALFTQALDRCNGNRSRAADLLGLNRNTLARRLSELDGTGEETS